MKKSIMLTCAILLLWSMVSPAFAAKCADCHQVTIISSIHQDIACEDCHSLAGAPPHKNPKALCANCHDQPDKLPKVTFHGKKAGGAKINCAGCHPASSQPELATSVHKGISCEKCHTSVKGFPHEAGDQKTDCSGCHGTAVKEYEAGLHGQMARLAPGASPRCIDCHGKHNIMSEKDPNSPISKLNQPKLCLRCHSDSSLARRFHMITLPSDPLQSMSLHGGLLLTDKREDAPTCASCHTSHNLKESIYHDAPMSFIEAPTRCGLCHEKEYEQYVTGVHGQLWRQGKKDSPICTTCHVEHEANRDVAIKDPKLYAAQKCISCHQSARLIRKYEMPGGVVASYKSSFHGLAQAGGDLDVAECGSCHSFHEILPASDPRSSINSANLVTTCGKPECHNGQIGKITQLKIHIDPQDVKQNPMLYWVRFFYLLIIFLTIGGMLGHNALDLFRIWNAKRRESAKHGVLRMSINERFQHFLLYGSFIILAVTGFMLKFPDIWLFSWAHGTALEPLRGLVHRIAAAVMVSASLWHIAYLILSPRGRQLVRDLFPNFLDISIVYHRIFHMLWPSHPDASPGRFSYIEKAEYWALVWGTIVMGVTGVMLWFKAYVFANIGGLGYDVARLIHFYEAILACLAILVWHFYFVFLRPGTWPGNVAWFTGKLTHHEQDEEHPGEKI